MIFWTVRYTNTQIQIHKYTNTACDEVPEIPNICYIRGSTYKGEKTKVKKLEGALSNPIPLVKRSSEQFLFLRLHVWKALPSIFSTSMGISMGK